MLAQRRQERILALNPSQNLVVCDAKDRAAKMLKEADIAKILDETQTLFFKWVEYDTDAFETSKNHECVASAKAAEIEEEVNGWLEEYQAIAAEVAKKPRALELLLKIQMRNALAVADDEQERARQVAEKHAEEERVRLEAEKLAAKHAEEERVRLEAEKLAAAKRAEEERVRLEAEKLAAAKHAEEERVRLAAEKVATEMLTEEKRTRQAAEQQRLAKEKKEQENARLVEADRQLAEKLTREEAEGRERIQSSRQRAQLKLLEEQEVKEWRQDKLWKAMKIIPSVAAGGALGFFAGSKAAAVMSLSFNAGIFIGCCTVGGAALFLLAALLINRYITGRPGFFPTRHNRILDHEPTQRVVNETGYGWR